MIDNLITKLFIAFLGPGVTTFGGGPSAIPLIEQQVVQKYGWLTTEEFADALALGNSLPGPIATKLAALVGYKVMGIPGALITIFATVAPTAIAIILLLKVYLRYKDQAWLKGMMSGVRPVIVMMLLQVTVSMGQKSFPNITAFGIAIISGAIIFLTDINPVILIVLSLAFGSVFMK